MFAKRKKAKQVTSKGPKFVTPVGVIDDDTVATVKTVLALLIKGGASPQLIEQAKAILPSETGYSVFYAQSIFDDEANYREGRSKEDPFPYICFELETQTIEDADGSKIELRLGYTNAKPVDVTSV